MSRRGYVVTKRGVTHFDSARVGRRRDDPVYVGVVGFVIGIATGAVLALAIAWPW